MFLLESFGTLSKLTHIYLESCLPTSKLLPIMGLPEMEHLSIGITDQISSDVTALRPESTCLTKLELDGLRKSQPRLLVRFPASGCDYERIAWNELEANIIFADCPTKISHEVYAF